MSKASAVQHSSEHGARFDPLFQAHYEAIHRYCVRRLGTSEAEDAAADVFATAWRRLEDMPEGDAERAWLFAVAYRVVANRYRGRRRQRRLADRLEAQTSVMRHPEGPDDDTDRVLRALEGLSATDQELLRLAAWDGLSRDEMALVLGIKENAVDQRLHRARSRLRAGLERLEAPSISPTKEATT